MLSDPELFALVEKSCREQGIVHRFEAENGEIQGRMMIDVVDIPDGVRLDESIEGRLTAFEASFDFTDAYVGLVLCISKIQAASGFWFRNLQDDHDFADEWVRFFATILLENIGSDGSYGTSMYVFFNENGSFSAIPTICDE